MLGVKRSDFKIHNGRGGTEFCLELVIIPQAQSR